MRDEEYLRLAHGHTGSCAHVTSVGALMCTCYTPPQPDDEAQELHDRIRQGVVCAHCGEMPCTNKNVQFSIQKSHDPYCQKWVPDCQCRLVYVDEWVGSIPECEVPSYIGGCQDVKLDPLVQCTCTPEISTVWRMPDMREFTIDTRWYSQSGDVKHCCGCNEEDHTGDIQWEDHRCPGTVPLAKPKGAINPDDDIPF